MIALLAALVLGAAQAPEPVASDAPRPNILFLFADDQRADSIAAFARGEAWDVATPNLDALAARGTVFDNAYCMGSPHGAVCQPSRAMLMTGRGLFRATLSNPPEPLLPELLGQAGYATFGTGKWHNGRESFARAFLDGGSIFFGGMGSHTELQVFDFDPTGAYPNDRRRKLREFSSTEFISRASEFLDLHARSDAGPFFCYVSFTAPHDPRTPPEEFRALYPPAEQRLPANFAPEHPFDNGEMKVRDERLAAWPRDPAEVRRHIAEYNGMITQLDSEVGRVIETLERTGALDNTVIVFAADHGLAVGSHGLLGKQSVYEHSMRAPLIVAGPGVRAGARCSAPTYLHDLYPTLLGLGGVAVPDHVESMDLGPHLRGEEAPERDALMLAYKREQRAIRSGKWKLCRYPAADRTQLFDLEADPAETRNLAHDPAHADTVERLLARLAELQAEAGDDLALFPAAKRDFEASWDSLAEHASPAWFEDAKLGIFIHWGVYSVPAWCDTSTYSEWYRHWVDTNAHNGKERRFHAEHYGADFTYEDFAPEFRAELFDPAEWAALFRQAGADYVVLTSKHHDGYALWPSREASASHGHPWNSMEVGPGRDLVGELTDAVRAEGLRMGLYYSFMEWDNPLYDGDRDAYVERVMFPQVRELIARYAPAVFWPDGEWNHPDSTWRSPELLSWIYNHAPNPAEIVVNDRWGSGLRSFSGDYYTTEYGGGGERATSNERPWEECRGIGHSFAFNRAEGYDIYMSRTECVRELIDIVSRGGRLLLDIGPTADGRIPVIMQDRLRAIGRWLEVNGESIHASSPSPFRRTPWGRATVKDRTLYLHVYEWPAEDRLVVADLATEVLGARVLGSTRSERVPFERLEEGGVAVDLSGEHPLEHATVVALSLAGKPRVHTTLRPLADGSYVLHAEDAATFGGGLRVEGSAGGVRPEGLPAEALAPDTNLGYWTEASSGARWELAPTPGTRYAVELVVGVAPGQEGSVARVTWGDGEVRFRIARDTGAWHDYATVGLGEMTAPAKPSMLTLTVDDVAAGAALNLKAVVLRRL